ncbi:MAG TPA: hypothetical protein VNS81_10730 [Nocardioides sp.]|nr:hypothetical protein [Nocardioides sp.]
MVDTRGGRWLLGITLGLLLLVMAIIVLVVGLNDFQVNANDLSQGFTLPLSLLLPVSAIVVVTSEWSQRTALTTFSLEPHRVRVIGAKLVAVSTLAVGTIVVAMLTAVVTNLLCSAITGNPLEWRLDGSQVVWTVVNQLAFFGMAFALACLLLNTPGAVSIYYVVALLLPIMLWGTLYAIFDWAKDVLPWIDINTAMAPLTTGRDIVGDPVSIDATNYVQAIWTFLLWAGLPVALGLWRILRAELK